MKPVRLIKFTKQGLEDLKKSLFELQATRPAAVLELKRAREMGDLSENGLYKAARMNLSSIDARLRRMTYQVKVADVYTAPEDSAGIGSRVTVEQNGERIDYEIVGDIEADPASKKISSYSPIGKALLGKKINDLTEILTPKGILRIKILKLN